MTTRLLSDEHRRHKVTPRRPQSDATPFKAALCDARHDQTCYLHFRAAENCADFPHNGADDTCDGNVKLHHRDIRLHELFDVTPTRDISL